MEDKIEYNQGLAIKLVDGSIISAKGDSKAEVHDRLMDMTALHDELTGKTVSTANPTTPQHIPDERGEPYFGDAAPAGGISTFDKVSNEHYCTIHNVPLELKYSKTKFTKEGKPKPYYAHIGPDGLCFGEEKK